MNKVVSDIKKKINVTLLIVLYQGNKVLEINKTIRSIMHQRHIPNEIIIIQNGNLESSLIFYLRNLIRNYNFCKLYKINNNKGLAFALNYGLRFSKNNLIARIDPDDEVLNDRFFLQKRIFDSKDIGVLGGFAIEKSNSKEKLIKKPEKHIDIYSSLKLRNPLIHSSIMFNKKKILTVGGYPNILKCQDYLLWVKCLEENLHFMNLNIPLINTYIDKKMMQRRGLNYFKYEFKIYFYMYKKNIIKFYLFFFNISYRLILRLLPVKLKLLIYSLR